MTYYYYVAFMDRPVGHEWGYGSSTLDTSHKIDSSVYIEAIAKKLMENFATNGKPVTDLVITNFILLREEP